MRWDCKKNTSQISYHLLSNMWLLKTHHQKYKTSWRQKEAPLTILSTLYPHTSVRTPPTLPPFSSALSQLLEAAQGYPCAPGGHRTRVGYDTAEAKERCSNRKQVTTAEIWCLRWKGVLSCSIQQGWLYTENVRKCISTLNTTLRNMEENGDHMSFIWTS